MKLLQFTAVILFLQPSCIASETQTLVDTQGRSIKVVVRQLLPDKVEVTRVEDGKQFTILLDRLDQATRDFLDKEYRKPDPDSAEKDTPEVEATNPKPALESSPSRVFQQRSSGTGAEKRNGVITQDGQVIVDDENGESIGANQAPIWQHAKLSLEDKQCVAYTTGQMWGIKDHDGKVIVEPAWDSMRYDPAIGRFLVSKNNKWGLIAETGDVLWDPLYDRVGFYFGGYALAKKSGGVVFIDASGEQVGDSVFSDKDTFPQIRHLEVHIGMPKGRWWVKRNGEWGVFDIAKDEFLGGTEWKPGYGLGTFVAGTNWFLRGDLWGLIDVSGKIIAEPQWVGTQKGNRQAPPDRFGGFYGKISKNGKIGAISLKTGEMILEPIWDDCRAVGIGSGGWMSLDSAGSLNAQGNKVWDDLKVGDERFWIWVRKENLWGLADSKGATAIKPQFTDTGELLGTGRIKVKLNGEDSIIDLAGNKIGEK